MLPITTGGGSNLKAAEAILSGRKIVATQYAFRGYEEYLELPNIYLADAEPEFKKSLLQAINSKYIERTPEQVELAEHVKWEYCLQPISKVVKKLARTSLRAYTIRIRRLAIRKIRSLGKRLLATI
jgi:hypothetical protein